MKVVAHRIDYGADEEILAFTCPGCRANHYFCVYGFGKKVYSWNGLQQKATVMPEMVFEGNKYPVGHPKKLTYCRCIILNGEILFGEECEHELAGKTVPMVDFVNNP